MIDISNLTLGQKAILIAHEIVKHEHDPVMVRLAEDLKTPYNDLQWVKNHIKYKVEDGVLYEPETVFHMGYADCKDMTLIIATLAKIQGYPVKIRVISNHTNHIFPLVKVDGEWIAFDAVPHPGIETNIQGMPINVKYYEIIDGYITDNPDKPLKVDYMNTKVTGISGKKSELLKDFESAVITGAGVALGTAIEKLIAGSITGLYEYKQVKVPLSYQPKPGDELLFYFKPKWYLPNAVEEYLAKSILKKKIPYVNIISANYVTKNGHKSLVVDTVVRNDVNNDITGLATIITAGIIATAIIGGGLLVYYSLEEIDKIVKEPEMKATMTAVPYALLIGAGALLLSELSGAGKNEEQ